MSAIKFQTHIKVITIGACGIGKTCLLQRIAEGVFNENSIPTIGVGMYVWQFKASKNYEEGSFQFWDTAGQERFAAMVNAYYRDVHLIFFCMPVESFLLGTVQKQDEAWVELKTRMEEVNRKRQMDSLVYFIGTKLDTVGSDDLNVLKEFKKKLVDYFSTEFALDISERCFFTSSKSPTGTTQLQASLLRNIPVFRQIQRDRDEKSAN